MRAHQSKSKSIDDTANFEFYVVNILCSYCQMWTSGGGCICFTYLL